MCRLHGTGANSSAVEHLVYTEAVGGSNPSSRTRLSPDDPRMGRSRAPVASVGALSAWLSGEGLGGGWETATPRA